MLAVITWQANAVHQMHTYVCGLHLCENENNNTGRQKIVCPVLRQISIIIMLRRHSSCVAVLLTVEHMSEVCLDCMLMMNNQSSLFELRQQAVPVFKLGHSIKRKPSCKQPFEPSCMIE